MSGSVANPEQGVLSESQQRPTRIIDCCCHIGPGVRTKVTVHDLLKSMEANQVERAFVSCADEYLAVRNREGNDRVIEAARNSSGRVVPMATANPWFGKDAVEELSRAFQQGATALVLCPSIQGFHITDSIVHPLIELAAKQEKPIYVHTGTPVCAEPFQLVELAMVFPDARFIMGHSGFSDFWNDIMIAGKTVENIWFETSLHWPSFVTELVNTLGSHRVLFGTSYPHTAVSVEIEKIIRYVPDSEAREHIFWRNAVTLFPEVAHAI